ncbi:hypothetical protein GCM10009862_16420 [Microbacterium binotii]|uniref:HNH endonuclease n=1 Tax=Microbacterium binotii TaxID=462710 RepID=A0ABN3PBW5_9MICO
MGKPTGFDRDTLFAIWDRDGGRCFKCGRRLVFEYRGIDWSAHHRSPRQMGGSKVWWINQAANGLLLCGSGVTGCHGWVEANRREAEIQGFIVRRGIRLPVDVPVEHIVHGPIYLTNKGTWTLTPPDPSTTTSSTAR